MFNLNYKKSSSLNFLQYLAVVKFLYIVLLIHIYHAQIRQFQIGIIKFRFYYKWTIILNKFCENLSFCTHLHIQFFKAQIIETL